MKVDFDITMEQFKENVDTITKGKKVVIWGAGSKAAEFIEQLEGRNDFVAYYVDKSGEKWNTRVGNIEVKAPTALFADSSVDIVIIATLHFNSIVKELEKMGFEGEVYDVFHLIYLERQFDYRPLEKHLEDVKGMLADEKSRNIVDFIYEKRRARDIDFLDIREERQYFVEGIVKVDPHAVFVDAGAYHGETIEEFISFQKGKFDKVYSFEMDKNNYAILKEKEYDERVKLLNYGLWNEKTELKYTSDGTGSILGKGDMEAQCISLDEVVGDGNVTFIKMDIEGAEINALLGAEKCIKRCKPQLAICIYHKSEDIYDITALIHQWLPEHKLYMRHHNWNFGDTVLYAIPDGE
jgi:FkbM family methyltransferase